MAQLDPEVVGSVVGRIVGVSGVIVFTLLVMRYKLRSVTLISV